MLRVLGLLGTVVLAGCTRPEPLDAIAEAYVELAFALDGHDPGYVDVYLGQERPVVSRSLESITEEADLLLGELEATPGSRRSRFLEGQLHALATRARGEEMTFEHEARALYGVTFPEIEKPNHRKEAAVREAVLVDDLEASAEASLEECRRRTSAHIELPEGESVAIEYVRGKPWASYHRYRGNLQSVIQINKDVSWTAENLLEAVCHESYPGHHTMSVLAPGLPEYSVQTLHSPYGFMLERLANAGARLVLADEERPASCLRPIAAEGARRYLEGTLDRVATVLWLEKHAAMPDAWAFLRFVDRYRGYTLAYGYDDELTWKEFMRLAKGTYETW